jgi:hypothetical protein
VPEADEQRLFMALVRAIAGGEARRSRDLLAASPQLAREHARIGATRAEASTCFLDPIARLRREDINRRGRAMQRHGAVQVSQSRRVGWTSRAAPRW